MNTLYELNTRPEFRHPAYLNSASRDTKRIRHTPPATAHASLARYGNERCNAHVNEALYLSLYVVTMLATCVGLALGA